jgi:shikimate dehydrogenase
LISGRTRVFAILGDPVGHSLSPRLHNAAFAHCGLDATFVALRTDADGLPQLMHALARAGGGGSVTVPHKRAAAGAVAAPAAVVRRTGACNTFWSERGQLCGDNTDVQGFREAATQHGVVLHQASVLLLGAGGAAAAVLAVLQDAAARVTIASRTPARAGALCERMGVSARIGSIDSGTGFDVIINATPLGLAPGDPFPFPLERVHPGTRLLDLVYAPGGTAWVQAARPLGIAAFDGTEMLLRQAAAAFRHWTGREAPLDVMRAALTPAAAHSS